MKSLVAYKQYRNLMKTGDMLEWRSKSVLGSTIRFFSKQKVNHTGICFAMDNYGLYDGHHIFTLEAEPDGIQNNLLSAQLQKFKGEVYWSPLKPEFEALRNKAADWALEQVGVEYDYGSLFKNAVSMVSANARKYFCSEYAFFYYVISGMLPQYTFDSGRGIIVDTANGKPIKAPVPGTFGQYKLHLPAIQIM